VNPAANIELLADRPDLIASLAEMRWHEWGADHPGREKLRFWTDVTAQEAGRDTLPVTFVAVGRCGQAVGGVGLAPFDLPQRTDRGPWVVGTIVRADHRGLGIGTALMTHLKRWAIRAGITEAWVATGGPAVDFYLRCGYAVTDVIMNDHGEPTTILTTRLTPEEPTRSPPRTTDDDK
jgi:GNAT superfamily N-acetyltransferase